MSFEGNGPLLDANQPSVVKVVKKRPKDRNFDNQNLLSINHI